MCIVNDALNVLFHLEPRIPLTSVLIFAVIGIGVILMLFIVSRHQK